MRILVLGTMMLSSSLALAFAPTAVRANDTQVTTGVHSQLSPEQSDRTRARDRKEAGDVRLGKDWRVKKRGHRQVTVGRDWRIQH